MAKQERYRGGGTFRRWSRERNLTLETVANTDTIIFKFYGTQQDKSDAEDQTKSAGKLVLLGCEQFDLSALMLVKVDAEAAAAHARAHKEVQKASAGQDQTQLSKDIMLDADVCSYQNLIHIDLKRVNASMCGEISIKCDYRPRVYPEGSGSRGRLDITSKLRGQMIKNMGLGANIK